MSEKTFTTWLVLNYKTGMFRAYKRQVETDSKIEYICTDFYLDGDGGDHKKYGYLCLVNNYLVYGKTKKELKIEIEYLKDKLFMEKI